VKTNSIVSLAFAMTEVGLKTNPAAPTVTMKFAACAREAAKRMREVTVDFILIRYYCGR